MSAIENSTGQSQHQQLSPLLFALVMGLAGALINTLSFPFLPQVELIFGNIAYVVVAMLLQPRYALLTALITGIPLYTLWGHPFGFVTFGLEALLLSYARSKGYYVLFTDILYWLVIGMPLTLGLLWLLSDASSDYWFFITLKQTINAALYTSLATLIMFFMARTKVPMPKLQPNLERSLRDQLLHAIVLIIILVLISSALFISRNVFVSAQKHMNSSLENTAERFTELSHLYIETQENSLKFTANVLSKQLKTQYQPTLDNERIKPPSFLALVVSDAEGRITHASPSQLLNDNQDEKLLIHTEIAKETIAKQSIQQTTVDSLTSSTIPSEINISVPIQSEAGLIGTLQGNLNILALAEISRMKFGNDYVKLVVVDSHRNIIYADKGLGLTISNEFNYDRVSHAESLPLLTFSHDSVEYAYKVNSLAKDWQVYSLIDYQILISSIEREYLFIFVSLIVSLIIAVLIANLLGKRLTRSLLFIIKQIKRFDEKTITEFDPIYTDAAIEMKQLYEEFKENKRIMAEYQHELEEKVVLRTQELKRANEKLQALALVDGLTKVFNRGYLNSNFELIQKTAQRNTALMAVVMLDLDHFKQLNDTHGHLAGDECLVRVAQLMTKEFCRDTDSVIRYGGEEFLLLVPYVTAAALTQKLESLRIAIEQATFYSQSLDSHYSVTASFGALIADADFSTDVTKWVKVADLCLYKAKASGRNMIVLEDKISRVG